MNPRQNPGGVLKVVFVPMLASGAKRAPATREISKAFELPTGGILEVAGPGYLIKAPTGTDRETILRTVTDFLRSEKSNPR